MNSRDITSFSKFLYREFVAVYENYSKSIDTIFKIWQFDKDLSLFLLKYILLAEHLLKASTIQVFEFLYPSLDADFKEIGIANVIKRYPLLAKVDKEILAKAIFIAEKYHVSKISFQTLIHNISFRPFITFLFQIDPYFKDMMLEKIGNGISKLFTVASLERLLNTMLLVRNLASHNGQLFRKVNLDIIASNHGGKQSTFFHQLTDLLKCTDLGDEMMKEYEEILEYHKDVNDAFRIWV